MATNKKTALRIVYFSIFFLFILSLIYIPTKGIVFSYLKAHPDNKIKFVLDKKVEAGLMIWGASTAKHHLDAPMLQGELNMPVFNMGEDGFVFVQYKGILSEYLSYASQDNTLVLVLSVFDLSKRGQIALQRYFLPYLEHENIKENLLEIDRGWTLKNHYVPFYSLINWDLETYKSAFQNYIASQKEVKDTLLGFRPLNKPEHFVFDSQKEPIDFTIDSTVVHDFIKVLNKRPEGMKAVIVLSPVYNKALDDVKSIDQFKKEVSYISRQIKAPVFDYLGRLEFNDSTLFCYNAHLNAKGADTLTRMFMEDVRQVIK